MKILFVNLPYPARFTRRYMCTYVSAVSLFPPYELMSVAGNVRTLPEAEIKLVDCVAENLNEENLRQIIKSFEPEVMLSLVGLESFERDVNAISGLKKAFPEITQVAFGHYPTIFAEEILKNTAIDIIIKGEPDEVMLEILVAISNKKSLTEVSGIAFKNENYSIEITASRKRILDINKLALPAHDLVNAKNYFEPFISSPFGMIQTSRGCPYTCNFCITTYGSKYTVKSAKSVIDELKWMKNAQGIRSFRIIDDTFTIQKQRVVDICDLMIKEKLDLEWTCLSRVDTVTKEMLQKMKAAGCLRIYFGIESGSQRILDFYKKGASVESARNVLRWCNDCGIQTVGLFMTGLPIENQKDFEETISFANNTKLTFAGVGELTPYPGTELYEIYKDDIEFNLFPYVLRFKKSELSISAIARRSKFHRVFYFKANRIWNLFKISIQTPKNLITVIKHLISARKYGTLLYPYLHK